MTDRLLARLLTERRLPEIEVTVADFTRIFISPDSWRRFELPVYDIRRQCEDEA